MFFLLLIYIMHVRLLSCMSIFYNGLEMHYKTASERHSFIFLRILWSPDVIHGSCVVIVTPIVYQESTALSTVGCSVDTQRK